VPRDLVRAGERIGPYTVIEPLGAGGMGEVYRAHDQRLDRDVAIKFLSRPIADEVASLERFEREARAASALNHPNICTVYDVGESECRRYIVMELLEGQSLKERMARSRLSIQELASITGQVCAALRAAPYKGIVHRDLKPANIFVTASGPVKVLDFGLAKRGAEIPSPGVRIHDATQSVTLTAAGTILGTLAYMSPEQAMGKSVDSRSDIFSLGVALYEMATGRRPFRGQTAAGILGSMLTESPERPSSINATIPARLDRVILKALEKDPACRYSSAAELNLDLQPLLHSARTRRASLWTAAVVAVTAIAVGLAGSELGWFSAGTRPDVVPRQLTANPPEDPVMVASISPDGKTIAYGDFSGIHMRGTETGETDLIAPPEDYCFR
jgi:serine/threonine protein kinase